MVRIQNIDEFKSITESKFGFIVVFDGAANSLHQSKCPSLTDDTFSSQAENSLHWFSTILMAEKSFVVTP
jgi:hypothetical protein